MASVQIDYVELTYHPRHIRLEQPEPTVYPLAGAGKIVVEPEYLGRIIVDWGDEVAYREGVAELTAARAGAGIHVFSWTKEDDSGLYNYRVYIPRVSYGQLYLRAVDPYTTVFEIISEVGS